MLVRNREGEVERAGEEDTRRLVERGEEELRKRVEMERLEEPPPPRSRNPESKAQSLKNSPLNAINQPSNLHCRFKAEQTLKRAEEAAQQREQHDRARLEAARLREVEQEGRRKEAQDLKQMNDQMEKASLAEKKRSILAQNR